MMGLTQRQAECPDFITGHILLAGESPTQAEIADGIGTASMGHVQQLLRALKERGFLAWQPGKPRSITLTRGGPISLAPELLIQLDAFCAERGEDRDAVVADALVIHLDQLTRAEPIGEAS